MRESAFETSRATRSYRIGNLGLSYHADRLPEVCHIVQDTRGALKSSYRRGSYNLEIYPPVGTAKERKGNYNLHAVVFDQHFKVADI